MNLNELRPDPGSKKPKLRVGRGIGSGLGKTCGKGHKGQKSRSGGFHKIHFEGGQMPIQRRLPKTGFTSKLSKKNAEIALSIIANLDSEVIDLETLKSSKLIGRRIENVKVILTESIEKPITIKGLKLTKGAKECLEKAGGKIQD